jgi:RHS repeat-associated protein
MRDSAGVTTLHADHLSSTTNTTGARSATQRYLPYGARRGSGTVATAYRYTGQWEAGGRGRPLSLGGIYHYRARWYDPVTGRFLQPDPLVPSYQNPQSLNRYSYVLGNPLKYNDPSGNLPAWLHFSLGAGYGILNDMTWGITGRVLRDWEQEQQYDFQRGAAAGARVAQGVGMALTAHGLATAVTVTGGGAIVTAASGGAAAVVAVPVVLAVDAVAVAEAAYGVSIVAAAAGRPPRVPTYGEGNFGTNLAHRVPQPTGGNYDAHHMLPKKFAEQFQKIGINVHDPRWGAWVETARHTGKGGIHPQGYNDWWAEWLGARDVFTVEDVVAFAEQLALEKGIHWVH